MLRHRRGGILLHPTSLPGPQHTGSLGREAREFIDFLADTGQSVWQILPLNPTGYGNCPYSCFSAFAGNPLLISLADLAATGDLAFGDLPNLPKSTEQCDFAAAHALQMPLLQRAWNNFKKTTDTDRYRRFTDFCDVQSDWLTDYALFETIRADRNYQGWQDWPDDLRRRTPAALQSYREKFTEDLLRHKYYQFVFYEQWFALKAYASDRGILLFGDLPIFVAENSADVWAHPHLFHLDQECRATLVAGVPPDYFSATGQRWGNPLYRWDQHGEENFAWWISRFNWNFDLFDLVRVDHFRGFCACWAIPAADQTAQNGYWIQTPGRELFEQLLQVRSDLPIIAEDLGIITPDVEQLREDLGFPGMKILQFAFDSDAANPYLPHNHRRNAVIYTGTHDNNTTLGWWHHLADSAKSRVEQYLGRDCSEMPRPLVEVAFASVARLAVIPLQDLLGLPESARINTPGTATGNWGWRYPDQALDAALRDQLRKATHLYGRDLCKHTKIC